MGNVISKNSEDIPAPKTDKKGAANQKTIDPVMQKFGVFSEKIANFVGMIGAASKEALTNAWNAVKNQLKSPL